jgi:hypothetical protein
LPSLFATQFRMATVRACNIREAYYRITRMLGWTLAWGCWLQAVSKHEI